jgi:thiamine kinase-like enzyme
MPIKHVNHNDYLPNNFIFTKDTNELYLIDYQDYTEGSKWPLHDLLRLLRHLQNNIDANFIPVIIDSYLSNMPNKVKYSMNVENQIRFSLLKSIIYSLLWRMNNGMDYSEQKVFLSSLLKNKKLDAYSQFVLELIKQHINEEKLLLSSF